MPITKGIATLLAEAEAEIETLTPAQARELLDNDDVQFIDLRDVRELQKDGIIPGAFHTPRGFLEFWVDPESKYFKDVYGSGKKFVFFCKGGWRSALAAQQVQRMGLEPVCHFEGGFDAWKEAGYPVAEKPSRRS